MIARICLYSCWRSGLNIVIGFVGLLDLGYVAFFGIGSVRLCRLLASPQFGIHLPFLLALPIVVLVSATFGVLIGAPTLRLRGDYLAIVTLGFGEITYILLIQSLTSDRTSPADPERCTAFPSIRCRSSVTRSAAHQRPALLAVRHADGRGVAGIEAVARFTHRVGLAGDPGGRIGGAGDGRQHRRACRCRRLPPAPRSPVSAAASLASWQRSVFPDNFLFTESVNILAMVILGGVGNLLGVILGATVIVAMPEVFRDFVLYRLLPSASFGRFLLDLPPKRVCWRSRRNARIASPRKRPRRSGGASKGS